VSDHESSPKPLSGLIGTDSFLSGYRHQLVLSLAVIALFGVTPFGIYNIVIGESAMGATILVLVGIFWIDAIAVRLKKSPPIPFPLLVVPLAACVTLTLSTHGLYALIWCTPTLMFCYFVMEWRAAFWVSAALAVFFSGVIYHFVDTLAAIRYFASAGISIAAINIIVKIITDLQTKLMAQIITDPLTGAFNRRHMAQALADAIERNKRTGAPASLLAIDLDHFKQINDTYGHAGGDEVLKGLVALVTEKSRKLDRLFRTGGEEFLLLLPDTKANDASVRAENLRRMVAEARFIPKRGVTASIGVSELANDVAAETWIKRADDALYAAKQGGRDRVVCAASPPPEPVAGAASAQPVA
jgi:diguanylate cyclase (GGDEF)-like protein